MQDTTPSEELVTRGRRDMTYGLETCLLRIKSNYFLCVTK